MPQYRDRDPRVAEAIIRERSGLGVTMAELARAAGLSYTTLWRIENKVVEPTMSTLNRIAVALNCDPARFIP